MPSQRARGFHPLKENPQTICGIRPHQWLDNMKEAASQRVCPSELLPLLRPVPLCSTSFHQQKAQILLVKMAGIEIHGPGMSSNQEIL